jgi:glycerol uptake facilitator-like aquaporin
LERSGWCLAGADRRRWLPRFPNLGIGFIGVALAFGLTVLTMAYAIGHISGCHLNPAVSFGLLAEKRFSASDLIAYLAGQLLGGMAGAGMLYLIASGKAGFDLAGGFASNGYGAHSPGGYSVGAAFLAEVVLTFAFLFIIMGATDKRAPSGFAPIAIGLGLTLLHFDWDTGDQSFGEPGAEHRTSRVCRRLGAAAIVAVLGGADLGWYSRAVGSTACLWKSRAVATSRS